MNKSVLFPDYELPNIVEWVTHKFQTGHQFLESRPEKLLLLEQEVVLKLNGLWNWRNTVGVFVWGFSDMGYFFRKTGDTVSGTSEWMDQNQ